MVYAVLDIADDAMLRVVLAGHDQGMRIRVDGEVADLGRYGTLLGVVPPSSRSTRSPLAPGDLVVFHTDGVTDAPGDEALATRRAHRAADELRSEPLDEIGRQCAICAR